MKRLVAVLIALGAPACAGVKVYQNEASKNLVVRSEVYSGMRAFLHVSQIDPNCKADYQGRVALDRRSVAVGIPPEKLVYLVVTFDHSPLIGSSSRTNVGTLFKARGGDAYELTATYRQNIFRVSIREIDPNTGSSREIPRRELSSCART